MASTRESNEGCGGCLLIILIILVVLKLAGVIDWGWGAVLAPMWVPLAISVGAMAIVGIIYLVFSFFLRDKD